MKKILTLLIAAGAFATVHAQSREENRRVVLGERRDNGNNDNRNDRDVILNRGGNNGQYPGGNTGDRQSQVDQVNREYDNKIYSIRNNPHLNEAEKQRTIRQLENDRQRRIDEINRDYNNNDNRDRYDRKDNGKHKGWYKKAKNKNWKNGKRNRD
ncbi:MAG TPA: hypothetical protein VEX65_06395 [Flavisolibacter sp.]|jgi:hypothetical protein|nr:hypothetical protein [Flavisolibacter sp.]